VIAAVNGIACGGALYMLANERMSAARAHQVGLVSEVVPMEELLDRAMWVANAIASAPVLAIQGTVRAAWMAHELTRRHALQQVSTLVTLGTRRENIAGGQETFRGGKLEWRLR
jgi:enoyl-CoA hydratase/carnithine racemase